MISVRTAVQKWMVMGMARGLGDGLLRLCHGAWRDNDGDAVDIVEVVRCKDCIHWYEPEGVCLKIYSDGNVSPYAWQDRKPDDFCSCGKKKI